MIMRILVLSVLLFVNLVVNASGFSDLLNAPSQYQAPVGTIQIPNGNSVMVCEVSTVRQDSNGNITVIIPTGCINKISNIPQFNDVPPTYWAYDSISAIAAFDVTAGCGNNNFCPDRYVTRAELAVWLDRMFGLTNFLEK